VDIMGNMKFLVADSNTTRFYPFVEYVIEGGETTGVTPGTTPGVTAGVTPGKTPAINVTVTTPPVVATSPAAATPPPVATTKKTEPGFEAIFAITFSFLEYSHG